jgi:hypothetical protein
LGILIDALSKIKTKESLRQCIIRAQSWDVEKRKREQTKKKKDIKKRV